MISVRKVTIFIISSAFVVEWLTSSIVSGQRQNLCELCDCSPNSTQPTFVNCNCKREKVLLLKDDDTDILLQTQSLNISGCNFISFPPNGFQKSKKLKTLEIKMMKLLHVNSGVFPALTSLIIEGIDELTLYGFQGQNSLINIEIKRSSLREIPKDCFKTVKSLTKLSFVDTSIATILSHSIHLVSTTIRPTIKFTNCKIDEIQTEGITAYASRLELRNTTVDTIDSDGINLNATEIVDIANCKFGPFLHPDSLKLKAPIVAIVENEFASLPDKILAAVAEDNRGVVKNKINFVRNSIRDIDLGGFLLNSKSERLNFTENKIVCDCSPAKTSILRLSEIFPGLSPGNDETYFDRLIDSNYCDNYDGTRLSDFKRRLLNHEVCYNDNIDLTNSKTPLIDTKSNNSTNNRSSSLIDRSATIKSFIFRWIFLLLLFFIR